MSGSIGAAARIISSTGAMRSLTTRESWAVRRNWRSPSGSSRTPRYPPRRDVRSLLRGGLAVLSVAADDHDGALPAWHAGALEHSAAGRVREVQARGHDAHTFAVALRRRGYATSMLGKYLNGYGDPTLATAAAPIPVGWSDWHVSNRSGYPEFDYDLDENGRV